MLKVKPLTLMLVCLWVLSSAAQSEGPVPAKNLEPIIVTSLGVGHVTDAKGKKSKIKRHLKLRERVTLETSSSGWVQIALTKNEQLVLGPSTRVVLPLIQFEDGAVERIELEKGRMRLINHSSAPRVVVTEVSRDPYSESDLLFDYDPSKKSLRLVVFEGRARFRGLENEEDLLLADDEQATFRGAIEDGELAFDVLLQGRRVVRGKMSEKSKVDPSLKEMWITAFEKMEKQVKAAKKAEEKKVKGAICSQPQGKLNQCVWRCENNPKGEKSRCRVDIETVKCVRERCNAGGNWSDRTPLVSWQSPCQAQPIVKACDY